MGILSLPWLMWFLNQSQLCNLKMYRIIKVKFGIVMTRLKECIIVYNHDMKQVVNFHF